MALGWICLCYMNVFQQFIFSRYSLKFNNKMKHDKVALIVFFTPPPMFVHGGTPSWVPLIYLIATQLMFQLGWATVQIGHLALIPQ